ncbi:MAG: hypothetical protein ACK5YR_23165 [Pirellula sp.]|jgi:hypothetical protein
MRSIPLIAIALCASFATAQEFSSVSDTVGIEMIETFAENRERFSSFACRGEVTVELTTKADEIHPRFIKFAMFEDQAKRSSRTTYEIRDAVNLGSDMEDVFTIKGRRILGTFILDGVLVNPGDAGDEYIKNVVKRNWLPTDPWSWSFIPCASLDQNNEDALLWMQVFREEKLLWVQDNGKLIRAEWDVGELSRIQAYFDPAKGNMPVYCRYIVPIDKEVKFGKKSRLLFNEIETEWAKHLEGWVPTKVRNYRESLSERGKIVGSETWNFDLDWDSKLTKDGVVEGRVFEMGKLNMFQLHESFSKGTTPKK